MKTSFVNCKFAGPHGSGPLPRPARGKAGNSAGLLVAALLAGGAHAQSSGGMAFELGDSKIYPAVGLQYVFTDNVFLDPDSEVEASGVKLSPSARWEADKGTLALSAQYTGEFADYDEDSLDFDDHSLAFDASAEFSRRLRGKASIGIARTHEELGTNLTEGISTEVADQVVFNNTSMSASVTYGAAGARGNLSFGLSYFEHNATNLVELASSSEYNLVRPFAEFSLRISADTRLVFGLQYSQIDYDTADSRDRSTYSFLTGLDFAPTGKLSGSFRVGLSQANYDDDAISDDDAVVLNAALRYQPVSYSRFTLTAKREFDLDSNTLVSSTSQNDVTDRISLAWRHEWSSKIYHQASVGYYSYSRDCPSYSTETVDAGLGLNYYLRRWLEVGVSMSVDSREGDFCDVDQDRLDYDRQRYGIGIRATL